MNKLSKILSVLSLSVCLISCADGGKSVKADYGVVPLPQQITLNNESPFVLNASTKIIFPEGNDKLKQTATFLSAYIKEATGKELQTTTAKPSKNAIVLQLGGDVNNSEGYQLITNANGVTITGTTEAGVFYGVQTLRKAVPALSMGMNVELASVAITDYPRFKYRGTHLDVGRHFFSIDSIKRFIDILALSNINNFHWHLTDDQGWRIEIKKYPKLAEIASQRKETVIGRNSGEYDGKPYGGYYTQDQIREVIAYATERFINVVPEIDLPGHMQAALSAYPEYGCTGGPYEAATTWGVFDEVLCAGNDQTMTFVEDVLAEVIDLFPSPYIHIGGDECPKTRWKTCPKCQARIKAEGLKSDKAHSAEDRLQSYVITRMEKFVNSKGRRIIGWDEILEGGLAPNATVMAWTGIDAGVEAAMQKHDVIMTPGSYVYFDHYQSLDTDRDPLAIGGYNNIERVYSFEPVPAVLTGENRDYVIGAQANMWTEYMPNFAQVEYMLVPRVAALSEVLWTAPEKKDYQNFLPRLLRMTNLYQQQGYNFAKHVFDVKATYTPDPATGKLVVTLTTLGEGTIYYTLDGTEPTASSIKYEAPLEIAEDAVLKSIVVRPAGNSRVLTEKIGLNKASLKPITFNMDADKGYTFNGAPALIDGLRGNENYKTGRWIGFRGNAMDVTIDLKEVTEVQKVDFTTLVVKGDWVMGATGVTVSVSDDGKTFREVATKKIAELTQADKDGIYPHEITFAPVKTRYIKVVVPSGKLPAWHGGAGNPAYMFVDEIAIN